MFWSFCTLKAFCTLEQFIFFKKLGLFLNESMLLEEFAFCGVEAGLVLLWELLPSLVRSLSTVFALQLSSLVLSFRLCLYLLLVAGEWVWDCICFKVVHPSGLASPHKLEAGVLGLFGDVMERFWFFSVCVKAYFYFGLTNPHASRWFLS